MHQIAKKPNQQNKIYQPSISSQMAKKVPQALRFTSLRVSASKRQKPMTPPMRKPSGPVIKMPSRGPKLLVENKIGPIKPTKNEIAPINHAVPKISNIAFQLHFTISNFRRKIAQPITKHKKALLLVTAGDDEDDGYNIIEKQVKLSFSVMNTELVGGVLAKDTDNGGVKEDDLRRAFELSKIIYG